MCIGMYGMQLSCTLLVYPCLLLAYIGQAAWLMKHEDMVSTTFYSSIPSEYTRVPSQF
jgi:KUP system potassium uptake protein